MENRIRKKSSIYLCFTTSHFCLSLIPLSDKSISCYININLYHRKMNYWLSVFKGVFSLAKNRILSFGEQKVAFRWNECNNIGLCNLSTLSLYPVQMGANLYNQVNCDSPVFHSLEGILFFFKYHKTRLKD